MVAELTPDGGEGMIDIPNLEFHYLRSYNKNAFVKGRNNQYSIIFRSIYSMLKNYTFTNVQYLDMLIEGKPTKSSESD